MEKTASQGGGPRARQNVVSLDVRVAGGSGILWWPLSGWRRQFVGGKQQGQRLGARALLAFW